MVRRIERTNDEYDWADKLFVDVAAEVEAEVGGRLQRRHLRRVASLTEALSRSADPLALVEGEPGCGKSVALRHFGLSLAKQARNQKADYPTLPLYVNLRDLDLPSGATIDAKFLREFIVRDIGGDDPISGAFLEKYFLIAWESGLWVLLLDSFDEIPDILSSQQADAAVSRFANAVDRLAGHGCRIVVASRQYRGPGRMQWPRFRILPLGESRRRQIVQRWFGDVEISDRVLRELVGNASIHDWLDNPLVLSLVCAHRLSQGTIPTSVHAAFESFVKQRIEQRPDVTQRFEVTPRQVRRALEDVAVAMSLDRDTGLTVKLSGIQSLLRRHGMDAVAQDALGACRCAIEVRLARGGLGSNESHRAFAFFHRRLQEYFATCVVLRKGPLTDWERLLLDERWRETAVTLLEAGDRSSRELLIMKAADLLEADVECLARQDSLVPAFFAVEQSDEALARLREDRVPTEFPWPAGSLHILGIAARAHPYDSAPNGAILRLQAAADKLLAAAFIRGLRFDQAWVLEVVPAAGKAVRDAILGSVFRMHSGWLQDIAFRHSAVLDTVPEAIRTGICRTLLARDVTGALSKEPTRTEAELRRIRDGAELLACVRLLSTARLVDIAALSLLPLLTACLSYGGGEVVEAAAAGMVAATLVYVMSSACWRTLQIGSLGAPSHLVEGIPVSMAALDCAVRMGALAVPLNFNFNASSGLSFLILPLGLALGFRTSARVAVFMGWKPSAWTWPFLSIVVPVVFAVRHFLVVVLLLILGGLTSGFGVWVFLRLEEQSLWGLLACGSIIALFVAVLLKDRVQAARFRQRTAEIDVDELLRVLATLYIPGTRADVVRWIREQGKLRPSTEAVQWLSNLLSAIERDYKHCKQAPRGASLATADARWVPRFSAWYDDYTRGKWRLVAWYNLLDEVARLREQVNLRTQDYAPPSELHAPPSSTSE